MMDLRMELKVCEGCGALWLRAQAPVTELRDGATRRHDSAPANVYCKYCVRLLASFPPARGPKKISRTRIRARRISLPAAVAGQPIHAGGAR